MNTTEALTPEALEQVRGMLSVPVSVAADGKNVVLLMGTARKLLATLDAERAARQEAADTSGLREAVAAWAETGPESREGNCGPLGVTPTDEGPEADDWCDRPAGHSGPHINVDNRDAYLRAALAAGATKRPTWGPCVHSERDGQCRDKDCPGYDHRDRSGATERGVCEVRHGIWTEPHDNQRCWEGATERPLDVERVYAAVRPEFRDAGPGSEANSDVVARRAAERIFARLSPATATPEAGLDPDMDYAQRDAMLEVAFGSPATPEARIVATHQCGDCGFRSTDLAVFKAHPCPATPEAGDRQKQLQAQAMTVVKRDAHS